MYRGSSKLNKNNVIVNEILTQNFVLKMKKIPKTDANDPGGIITYRILDHYKNL